MCRITRATPYRLTGKEISHGRCHGKHPELALQWAIGFIDMQAHVLNVFATADSNDNIR